jgi:hypothetical protein
VMPLADLGADVTRVARAEPTPAPAVVQPAPAPRFSRTPA